MALTVPAAAELSATALPATSDEGLAALAARGSQRAFTELYRRHRQPLYRYCRGILREHEDAEDAVQLTMTRALVALEAGTAPASWQAWLFGIARNHAIDLLRLRRRHGPLHDADHLVVAADDVHVEHRERLSVVLADLERLPERQRSALVLRELRGLSDREIAEALAISSDGVRQAVFEARTALKDFTLGREMPCGAVREMIAGGDRRRLRARQVRAHLLSCPACRAAHEAGRGPQRAAWWLPLWLQDLGLRLLGGAPASGHEALAGSTVVVKSVVAAAAATTIGIGLADRPPVDSRAAAPVPAPAPQKIATARPTRRLSVVPPRPAPAPARPVSRPQPVHVPQPAARTRPAPSRPHARPAPAAQPQPQRAVSHPAPPAPPAAPPAKTEAPPAAAGAPSSTSAPAPAPVVQPAAAPEPAQPAVPAGAPGQAKLPAAANSQAAAHTPGTPPPGRAEKRVAAGHQK